MEQEEFKGEFYKELEVDKKKVIKWVGVKSKITLHVFEVLLFAAIIALLTFFMIKAESNGYVLYGVKMVILLSTIAFFTFVIKFVIDLRLFHRLMKGKYGLKTSEVIKINYKRVIDNKEDKEETRIDLKCGSYMIPKGRVKEFHPGDLVIVVTSPKRKYPLAIVNGTEEGFAPKDN